MPFGEHLIMTKCGVCVCARRFMCALVMRHTQRERKRENRAFNCISLAAAAGNVGHALSFTCFSFELLFCLFTLYISSSFFFASYILFFPTSFFFAALCIFFCACFCFLRSVCTFSAVQCKAFANLPLLLHSV